VVAASLTVDRMADRGLRLAALEPATRAGLLDIMLPPYADNPVDIGGRRDENAEGVVGRAVELLTGDPDTAALLIVLTTTPAYETRAREMGAAAMRSGTPTLVVVTPGSAADGPRRALREVDCPYFDSLDEALRVLEHFIESGRDLSGDPATPSRADGLPDREAVLREVSAVIQAAKTRDSACSASGVGRTAAAVDDTRGVTRTRGSGGPMNTAAADTSGGRGQPGGTGAIDEGNEARRGAVQVTEAEVKRLLAAYGVSVTRERVVSTEDEAVAAAGTIGYPVVLKAISRAVVHKSDLGLVRLGLDSADAVRRAWTDVTEALARKGATVEGCLVSEMVRGEAEVIVGVKRDPQFGPVVLVGSGGVLVEVLRDVQMALAPVSSEHALRLLRALKLWPLLAGVRGRAPLDVDAIAGVVSRVSWLAVDLADRLVELDINPLIVRAAGGGAVAVDARATLDGADSGAGG
jgi:acyl-CoA synthetase (NDP forming)